MTEEDVQSFFTPSLKSLTDPLKLDGMDMAVKRLIQAKERSENICVYGDYDLDGNSGIALLVTALKDFGFKVNFYQPSRFLEGYGINSKALKKIKDRGDQLVVSVDCGITAVNEADYAREIELELIITDHHLPQAKLPECVAVINPNKGTCTSGLGHLCGVGVAFYLVMALRRALGIEYDTKSLLDFYSIGTVTDLVPLIKENRVLLKHGLKVLAETKRPGLQALIQALKLNGREITAQDIAFAIGPKLNALGRLERGLRPIDLLLCDSYEKASAMVAEILILNEERKKLQSELQEKIEEAWEQEISGIPAAVLAAPGHPGVVGLAATKLSEWTSLPAFVVAYGEREGAGSARGREEDNLPAALEYAQSRHPNLLARFGGHAQAAGFSLSGNTLEQMEKFKILKKSLLEYYSEKKNDEVAHEGKSVPFDLEINPSELDRNFVEWFDRFEPFGSGNPAPVFLMKGPKVLGQKWLKDCHLKINIQAKLGPIEALSFNARTRFEIFKEQGVRSEVNYSSVNFWVEPSWNFWQGEKRLQLMINHIEEGK